ncbi:protein FANTASTIC FOUR 3-like [Aristolochia californica]|uniref:protein FANTASTIC FOUR 3-like n=1 Tax=Aristolochia californica TaxID=171875 RepID=UPI0035DEE46A
MATCGSLRPFFENPLPENPTLLESLSTWNQIHPVKQIGLSNFTEIFGELHFKEKSESSTLSPSSSSTWSSLIDQSPQSSKSDKLVLQHQKGSSLDSLLGTCKSEYMGCPMHKDCFLSRNCESLAPPFTEGLGFESSDEVEYHKNDSNALKEVEKEGTSPMRASSSDKPSKDSKVSMENMGVGGNFKVSKTGGSFPPPPLTCIGKMGKPWTQLRSYRQDGRFVLREIKIPTLEIMRACREDGRLKLHLVQPDEESAAVEEKEEEIEEEQEEEETVGGVHNRNEDDTSRKKGET